MIEINTIALLKNKVNEAIETGQTIGFVPTMGFLHEGHMTLVKHARAENDLVIMSVFVNPAQFGPNEDFDRYPRDIKRDSRLAKEAGVDVLFYPQVDEIYPQDGGITIQAGQQSNVLCGASRPGHFDGVLKIVTKLFHIVQPTRAYFGQKDAQQLAIIETLVNDYNFPLEIRRVETVREEDGLAKSSRNVFLSIREREEASVLQKAIKLGIEHYSNKRNANQAIAITKKLIEEKTSGKIDYVELLGYPSLTKPSTAEEDVILAVAVFFEKARLIDNIILTNKGE